MHTLNFDCQLKVYKIDNYSNYFIIIVIKELERWN